MLFPDGKQSTEYQHFYGCNVPSGFKYMELIHPCRECRHLHMCHLFPCKPFQVRYLLRRNFLLLMQCA